MYSHPLNSNYWINAIKPFFQNKKVIVTGDTLAELIPRAHQIRALGAQSTFMLTTEETEMTLTPKDDNDLFFRLESSPVNGIFGTVYESQKLLSQLPQEAREALEHYDPDHSALVVGTMLHEPAFVAGRTSLAYRKPEWLALDDKTKIDRLWDQVGVVRAPYEIVSVEKNTLLAAIRRLNKGNGVVLSADNKQGVNSAARGLRWIRSEQDFAKAFVYYQRYCDYVRIIPFLEGIPCSIHGIVFPDYVAALRPIEMIVLRQPETQQFFYAGTASFWDPSSPDREEMRAIAKQVGIMLRNLVDYRGIFSIDGIMTESGFRPTELNTRSGAGIIPIVSGMKNFPLNLIMQTLFNPSDIDYKPEELEHFLIENADQHRGGGTWRDFPWHLPANEYPIELSPSGWTWSENKLAEAKVIIEPRAHRSFIRLNINNPSLIKQGVSFSPLAQNFWSFIDKNLEMNIGQLESAQSVRIR